MEKSEVMNFLKDRRFQWAVAIITLILVVFISSNIRLSNWEILKDSTTGERIPSDLDAFYFLRITETYAENNASLPPYDELRYSPGFNTTWHTEKMPQLIYYMHKFVSPWYSLRDVFLASPVIFFIFTLIFFFTLIYVLTKSKFASVVSTAFLAFTPAYLMRTMGGFADHDALGMMALILTFLVYVLSLKTLETKKKWYFYLISGILTGAATVFTIITWAGIARTLFFIFPLSFFLLWIFKTRHSKDFIARGLIYYASWIVFTLIFSTFFSYTFLGTFQYFMLTSQGILSSVILVFIVVDSILVHQRKFNLRKNLRVLYSLIGTVVIGIIGLTAMGKNVFSLIGSIFHNFLVPFGEGRFGETVAENQAPYLHDWIGQTGPILFWLFLLGTLYFGYVLGKNIRDVKRKIVFTVLYILMIVGVVFSKYSELSILNGHNFVSSVFYFLPLIAFWSYFVWLYFKEDFAFNNFEVFIFAWMFFTIVTGRAAARMFFAITPFVCLMAGYFILSLFSEGRKSKDDTLKIVLFILFILGLVACLLFVSFSYDLISAQAKYTGPSANNQWQKAMDWVRNNTAEDSIFAHWWDYGYWIESLGERRTVADGGHFQGAEDGNHKIGRYVLTTPQNETALSYFKTMDIDYLLIDPTDLGKYSAYARIGSDENWDRYTFIPVGAVDPTQTVETQNFTKQLYRINGVVDEDINYNAEGKNIFLPGPTFTPEGDPSFKAGIGGIVLTSQETRIASPEVIFVYNNQRYDLPVRYLYVNGELHDFGSGIEGVVMIMPAVEQNQNGQYINQMGGVIYLSPKVSKSLFAQLYLLDNSFGDYPTIEVAHVQDDPIVASLKEQNYTSDFLIYGGFRGPLKIWDVQDIPESIIERSEFYEPLNGNFAGLDDLEFTR